MVTTRHTGYQDFISVVEGLTDGSFIGWEKKSVVMLNVTDDPGGARTRRLLKENEAQVRERGLLENSVCGGRGSEEGGRRSRLGHSLPPCRISLSLSPLSSIPSVLLYPPSISDLHDNRKKGEKKT